MMDTTTTRMPLTVSRIAAAMPEIDDDAYALLRESIRVNGLGHPIWLYHGEILDGRSRYRACLETGRSVKTREYEGDEPVRFAMELNEGRREGMTHKQRVMAAVALREVYRAEQRFTYLDVELGALFGVKQRTMERALSLAQGSPEWYERFCSDQTGKVTLTGAWRRWKGYAADGRRDRKAAPAPNGVDVPEPTTGALRDWMRAFRDQRQVARDLAVREAALRGRVLGIEAEVARRARDLAADEFQRMVGKERLRTAVLLAFAEGRIALADAAALCGFTAKVFQRVIRDVRDYPLERSEGVG